MIRASHPIRTAAILMVAMMLLCNSVNAQSPLGPMPIGTNDTVTIAAIPDTPQPIFRTEQQIETAPASATSPTSNSIDQMLSGQAESLTTPESLPSSIKLALILGVLSLAPEIQIAKNEDSIAVFYQNLPQESASESTVTPQTLEDVPIKILLPAFLISELKVAFLLGFQIYLPFLILDLVVSSVTVSMGMVMLPPTMVSFPLKLILFVMVDGWNLVLGMLLQSFG